MADAKITDLTADATPTSDDVIVAVNDPGGTPANKKVTLANAITKAHGLSDGFMKVASGAMTVVASVGQSAYTFVVAASGGDYTTLGAALAVAASGDSIYVREGTYVESAITCSLNNLTIIGENPESTIISMGANACQFLGTDYCFQGFQLTTSTGTLTIQAASGDCSFVSNCKFVVSGAGLLRTAYDMNFNNNLVTLSSASAYVDFGYTGSQYTQNITGNRFAIVPHTSGSIRTTCAGAVFSANSVEKTSGTNGLHASFGTASVITGNTFDDINASNDLIDVGQNCLVTGNRFMEGKIQCDVTGSKVTVTGNNFWGYYNQSTTWLDLTGYGQCTVTGNMFEQNQGAGGSSVAITLTSPDNVVTGNYIKSFTTGISITTDFTSGVVANNYLHACTTPISNVETKGATIRNTGSSVSAVHQREVISMKNTSGATITAGEIVTLKAVAAGNEVTTTTTASDNAIFGVATESLTNNTTGYIQIGGKTTLLKVDGTTDIAVGDYITTFTTAGIGQKATVGTVGVTPGHLAIAVALEAYTANDSSGVIDALIIPPLRV